MTAILIVIGTFGTVTKGLVQGLEDLEITGQIETVQTTAWLRSTRILRRVLEETCCHSISLEKPLANAGEKNLKKSYNNNGSNLLSFCLDVAQGRLNGGHPMRIKLTHEGLQIITPPNGTPSYNNNGNDNKIQTRIFLLSLFNFFIVPKKFQPLVIVQRICSCAKENFRKF